MKNAIDKAALERIETLKAMNHIVKTLNHEKGYDAWCYIIPDESDDDEIADIAANDTEIYDDACTAFTRIISRYGKYGYYHGGHELYGCTVEE